MVGARRSMAAGLVGRARTMSSLLANTVSPPRLEPVNTPRTVSKLLPIVSINEFGAVTVNGHGATHVHHTLGVVPAPATSAGSPASAVAPMLDPVAVREPDPVIGRRLTNRSFDGSDTYVNPFTKLPA